MIVTIKNTAPRNEVKDLVDSLSTRGVKVQEIKGETVSILGLVGDTTQVDQSQISTYEWVINVQVVSTPFKRASRQFHPENSVIDVAGIKIGGKSNVVIMAGPCSVESRDQILSIAECVKDGGAKILRGGAYKPRTSPYGFQGMKTEGVHLLAEAREKTGLPVVSEIMSADKIDEFVENVDLIQVGARNMQNFELLKALGKTNKPILLKRGLANTIEEWLLSAEYIMSEGNPNVILCERGIRTFEKLTRNTLDIAVVPLIKKLSHLPIVIDPSHSAGHWDLIESVSLAAIAAGADGLIVEVHNHPEVALSDGQQSMKPKAFKEMMRKAKLIAEVLGRDI